MLTQISVFLENRSGQLVGITDVLTANGINIRAINIAETSDYGILRLVVDKSDKALSVLSGEGYIVKKADIVAVAVPDEVGGLNRLLIAISGDGIDIDYMYSIFGKADGLAYMIFKVSDPAELTATLVKEGFKIAEKSALGIS